MFVEALLKEGDERIKSKIKKYKDKFMRAAGVPADKWEGRFAQRFALAYAAAVLGIKHEILPWSRRRALDAIIAIYRRSRAAVPDYDALLSEALEAVKSKLRKSHGFLDLRPGRAAKTQPSAAKARAFIKKQKGCGSYFVVSPERLQGWIGDKIGVQAAGMRLHELGQLVLTERDVLTKQVLIDGVKGKRRYYCIRRSFVPQ
jgi:hypothetical protein